jgi:hypothetical protein
MTPADRLERALDAAVRALRAGLIVAGTAILIFNAGRLAGHLMGG